MILAISCGKINKKRECACVLLHVQYLFWSLKEALRFESKDKGSFRGDGKQTVIITVSADDNIAEIVAWAVD